jgi:uncharacterized protein VirK/YbjX
MKTLEKLDNAIRNKCKLQDALNIFDTYYIKRVSSCKFKHSETIDYFEFYLEYNGKYIVTLDVDRQGNVLDFH